MSFRRTLIAAVAAMGLATTVFADDNTNSTQTDQSQPQAQQTQTTDTTTTTTSDNSATQEKVNVNTATAKELAKVKGLNNSKAKAIVSYRKKHGDFKSIDDLKEVKSLKKLNPETMQSIEDQLTVG